MSSVLNVKVIPVEEVPNEDARLSPEQYRPVILVVDDEVMVADTLAVVLSQAGFATLTAYDGKAALELAIIVPPELLISDVAMPEMDGIELAMAVVDAMPECKILLFSGTATNADLASARAAGYNLPLLTKPVHPEEMLKHVKERLKVPAVGAGPVE
jgi:CheY-like chemotaxis protein